MMTTTNTTTFRPATYTGRPKGILVVRTDGTAETHQVSPAVQTARLARRLSKAEGIKSVTTWRGTYVNGRRVVLGRAA